VALGGVPHGARRGGDPAPARSWAAMSGGARNETEPG
jgi:hypothetical protein